MKRSKYKFSLYFAIMVFIYNLIALNADEINRNNQMVRFSTDANDLENSISYDCGAYCLRYISRYYKKPITLDQAYKLCDYKKGGKEGISMLKLKNGLNDIGMHTFGLLGPLRSINDDLFANCSFVILKGENEIAHYSVLIQNSDGIWYIIDPTKKIGRQVPMAAFEDDTFFPSLAISENPLNISVKKTNTAFLGIPWNVIMICTIFIGIVVYYITKKILFRSVK